MKRKFLIFICLFLFMASVAGVSASEGINQTDDSVSDTLSVSLSDDENVESANGGTFSDLQVLIDNAAENSTVNLEMNYTFDYSIDTGDFVLIEKNLTINGNGYTLDGNNAGAIFAAAWNVSSVTLNNINFVNAKEDYAGSALASVDDIKHPGSTTFYANGCSFVNNSAPVIYTYGGSIVCVDCTFVNNTGSDYFVYSESGRYVFKNNRFKDNFKKFDVFFNLDKSFFYQNDSININISLFAPRWIVDFTRNVTINFNDKEETAEIIDGVALFSLGTLQEVGDYELYINYEDEVYSANATEIIRVVSSDNYGSFKDLQDIINNATDGDVIELQRDYAYGLNAEDDTIIIDKNITVNGNGHTLDGDNHVTIMKVCKDSEVILNNISFINGYVISGFGAIDWEGDNGILANCSFANFNLTPMLTVVGFDSVNGILANCSFINCKSNYGTVSLSGDNTTLYNCSFVNCAARWGGAVHFASTNGVLFDCTFMNCFGMNTGGAVYLICSNATLYNCNFVNCSSEDYDETTNRYGGVVVWYGANGALYNCSFVDISHKKTRAVAWCGANGTLSDCSFINCINSVWFVEWTAKNGAMSNCSFINCNHHSDGGAVSWDAANGTLSDCSFINCTVVYGGLVDWSFDAANGTLSDCSFINCASTISGDIVYWRADNGTLSGCSFLNNVTPANGLGIIWVGKNGIITDSSFDMESMAIYIASGSANVTDNEVRSNTEYTICVEGSGAVTDNYLVAAEYMGDASVDAVPADTLVVNNTPVMERAIVTAEDVVMYYKNGTRYVIMLTDQQGNALANKTVAITLNGVSYNRTTDENGTASIAINLPSGNYAASVLYVGEGNFTNTTSENTVEVLPTVFGDDIVKVFRNATQYYATFLDGQGNPLANGTEVTFNINGVMYKRYINGSEGKAKLNINLAQGEYIITAINPVNDETASNNITVLASLTENRDIVKYYRNGTQYTVKVLGADGNPVGANVTVKFNINGVFYERVTNESGIAKLNINLQPGNYIITAEYEGCMVSNNITVLPVLNATDLTKKFGTPDPFVVTLVNETGNPYPGQNVTFNINGVFYPKTTDALGQAKLNINLVAGEYIITSSYDEANIANKVTVTS